MCRWPVFVITFCVSSVSGPVFGYHLQCQATPNWAASLSVRRAAHRLRDNKALGGLVFDQQMAFFSIVKYNIRQDAQSGLVFGQQMALFSIDKNNSLRQEARMLRCWSVRQGGGDRVSILAEAINAEHQYEARTDL